MNAKRLVAVVIFFVVLAGFELVKAQGPSITMFEFDPANGSNVGQRVTVHFAWTCNPNCGAAKVTVSCGGGDQVENTSGRFDFHWDTNGCWPGGQSVQICTRTNEDQQWTQSNCMSRGYELTGSAPAGQPAVNFWADNYNLPSGGCTMVHWRTSNADSVNIDGENFPPNGDRQVCPTVTKKYSIGARGAGGVTYLNFSIEVGSTNQQQTVNSTQSPQNNNIRPNGGQSSNNSVNSDFSSGPSISQAKQNGGSGGGFDLITVAYAWGCQGVHNEGGRWDGWIMDCNGSRRQLGMADFNTICQQVYGSDYHATLVGVNEGAVKCVQGQAGQQQPQISNPQPNNNGCGPNQSRLSGGMIAVVSDQDPNPLKVYNQVHRSSGIIFTVSVREMVSIISGPVCSDGATWVEVGYQGKDGWAEEVTPRGFYNLIPNGQPMPGSFNPQPNQQSSQTNANGQPLEVRPNGDLVYPKAGGSGGGLCVRGGINSLYLRSTPVADSSRRNVIGTMTAGDCYQLLQISGGWAQVQTSLGVGWVVANPQWVDINQPQVQPTAVPPTFTPAPVQPAQVQQAQDKGESSSRFYPCGAVAHVSGHPFNLIPEAKAASGEGLQCGQYVISYFQSLRKDISLCVGEPSGRGPNLTANWPGNVVANYKAGKTRCNWVIDSNPANGAIVTWDAGCPFGVNDKYGNPLYAGDAGHAAIVTFTPSEMDGRPQGKKIPNTILVDEANYGGDGKRHTNETAYAVEPCMHFIHVPDWFGTDEGQQQANSSQSGQSERVAGSGNVQPTVKVEQVVVVTASDHRWSFCIWCTPNLWLGFKLAGGHTYKDCWLGFRDLVEFPADINTVQDGSDIKATAYIKASVIQSIIDSGHNDDLNNMSSWKLHCTVGS